MESHNEWEKRGFVVAAPGAKKKTGQIAADLVGFHRCSCSFPETAAAVVAAEISLVVAVLSDSSRQLDFLHYNRSSPLLLVPRMMIQVEVAEASETTMRNLRFHCMFGDPAENTIRLEDKIIERLSK